MRVNKVPPPTSATTVANPSTCAAKSTTTTAATGRLLHPYTTRTEPDSVLRLPCKTRRGQGLTKSIM